MEEIEKMIKDPEFELTESKVDKEEFQVNFANKEAEDTIYVDVVLEINIVPKT